MGKDARDRPTLEDLDRSSLRAMETPQVFRTGQILRSYHAAQMHGLCPTDDAAAGAVLGITPVLVEASGPNPKITTSHDLDLVNFLMSPDPASFRIGHGYDIHRFAEGRRMVLGGVKIPHPAASTATRTPTASATPSRTPFWARRACRTSATFSRPARPKPRT
jgi:hypothetical protein